VVEHRVDPAKEDENIRKHGVGFDDARVALLDPLRVSWFDEAHSHSEPRIVTVGRDLRGRVLVVITSESPASPRIISARRATKRERYDYQERRQTPRP
jgi:uncharacterized DUF497 family protein